MNSSCTIARSTCSLIDPLEIGRIFESGLLYASRSFFVIDPGTRTYRTDARYPNLLDEARALTQAFKEGAALIVKNLEGFTPRIRRRCSDLGPSVDVHLYLTPPKGGASFELHADERDVLVHLAYGSKTFITREGEEDTTWLLGPGDELWIPKGVLHMAIPEGPSALLSFGIPRRVDYPIPGGLRPEDLGIESLKTAL